MLVFETNDAEERPMLSFLFRIASQFEQEHGYRPNLLYLGHGHYTQLKAELASIRGLAPMAGFLGMEIVLSDDNPHPRVAWNACAAGLAAAV